MGEGHERAVDRAIGDRIRRRRVELGLTQEQLGVAVGLSYQQIQKYERGSSRVAASKLSVIARELNVAPAHFFDDLVLGGGDAEHGGTLRPAIDVARNYGEIADPEVRSAVAGLVRALARHAR